MLCASRKLILCALRMLAFHATKTCPNISSYFDHTPADQSHEIETIIFYQSEGHLPITLEIISYYPSTIKTNMDFNNNRMNHRCRLHSKELNKEHVALSPNEMLTTTIIYTWGDLLQGLYFLII